jgi:hypothetical protein
VGADLAFEMTEPADRLAAVGAEDEGAAGFERLVRDQLTRLTAQGNRVRLFVFGS